MPKVAEITVTVSIKHPEVWTIFKALRPDDLPDMDVRVKDDLLSMKITGYNIGSLIATVDDYLANAGIAIKTLENIHIQ
jgi:hypothetical protein